MAEGFARHFGGDKIAAFSTGSHPAGFVAEQAVAAMKDAGVDISQHYSKHISEIPQQSFDYVVTMGCGDACPVVAGKKRIDWQIQDPIGETEEVFRAVRDEIGLKVRQLLQSINN